MKKGLLLLLCVQVVIGGCAVLLPPLSPLMHEERTVQPLFNQEKQVLFKEPMVWYDKIIPTQGILFPEGIYELEAEDDEYYYFKAPKEFDCRTFSYGKTIDIRFISGGLYLTKKMLNMNPAGAYRSISDSKKLLFFKLGNDFFRIRGNDWEKNY